MKLRMFSPRQVETSTSPQSQHLMKIFTPHHPRILAQSGWTLKSPHCLLGKKGSLLRNSRSRCFPQPCSNYSWRISSNAAFVVAGLGLPCKFCCIAVGFTYCNPTMRVRESGLRPNIRDWRVTQAVIATTLMSWVKREDNIALRRGCSAIGFPKPLINAIENVTTIRSWRAMKWKMHSTVQTQKALRCTVSSTVHRREPKHLIKEWSGPSHGHTTQKRSILEGKVLAHDGKIFSWRWNPFRGRP